MGNCASRCPLKPGHFLRLAFLVWILLCAHAPSPAVFVLRPGEQLERELEAGESHTYQVDLAPGGRWYLAVGQRGIDVIVAVSGPDGESLVAVDSPFDRQGQETALFEAETAGVYRIEIRSREAAAAPGRYEIRIEALDPRRLAAAAATTEGSRLYLEATREAWRRAVAAYTRAFEAWHGLGEGDAAARALYSSAVLHRLLEENSRALELDREVLPLWQRQGDRIFAANTLNEIGLNQWHLGKSPEARSSFAQALELQRQVGHRWGEAVASANLCLMELVAGELRAGAECYQQAIPLLDEVRAVDLAATAASNAGRAQDLLGEPEKALASYREAQKRLRVLGDPVKEARIFNNLGVLQVELGELQEALTTYGQALAIFQESGDRRWQAQVLSNVGFVYDRLGQLPQALAHYRQALALWREIEDPRGEASALAKLGSVHRELGKPREARGFLEPALALRRAAGDRREEALILAQLGRLALDQGDSAAAGLLDQSIAIFQEIGDRMAEAEALRFQGMSFDAVKRPQEALECLDRALELARQLGYRHSEARTLRVLARTERRRGDVRRARAHVEEAIGIIESDRVRIRPPTLRASYASTFHELYELYVELLMEEHRSDPEGGHELAALEASERARARTLLELLQESGADPYGGGDPQLLERRRSLQRRLDAKAGRAMRPSTAAARRAALQTEEAAILRELDLVEAQLRRRGPEPAAAGPPRPASAAEIQALLDDQTLLLVFALGEARSFLWCLATDAVTVHEGVPLRPVDHSDL